MLSKRNRQQFGYTVGRFSSSHRRLFAQLILIYII